MTGDQIMRLVSEYGYTVAQATEYRTTAKHCGNGITAAEHTTNAKHATAHAAALFGQIRDALTGDQS